MTVCCLLVDGPVVGYNVDYVVRLERMVRRHLARPFRFVCLTDGTRGELPAPIDTIPVPVPSRKIPANTRGIWAKLEVFNPRHRLEAAAGPRLEGRVLYLDLDTMPVAALDPIADYPAELALTADAFVVERAHLDEDRDHRKLVRRFNGSVMVWNAGAADYLFDRVTLADMRRLSTDQDWIGEQAADAQGMPLEWFPRLSHLVRDETFAATGGPLPPAAKVVLTKKPKNHDAIKRWPWFDRQWGGW